MKYGDVKHLSEREGDKTELKSWDKTDTAIVSGGVSSINPTSETDCAHKQTVSPSALTLNNKCG